MNMVDISTLYNGVRYTYGKLAKGLAPQHVMPPLRITFETTYRCNLSCSFCFQVIAREQSPEFRKNYELDRDEILRVVEDLPRYSLITFNGGEVFVRKDFPDILREVSKRGKRFNIVTNGTMLFEDKIRLLVDETNALSVGISIDGIGETHDEIRQLPKAFERTVSNMRDLAAYKKERNRKFPVIDMKTVITGQNVNELEEIYDLGRDIGVDYLTFSCLRTSELIFALPCRASMDDGAFGELPPVLDEEIDLKLLRRQLEKILAKADAGKPAVRFYPDYPDLDGIIKYYAGQGEMSDYEDCSAPWTSIRLAPNGDVYPCLSYRMGNIRDESIADIWKGAQMQRFRDLFSDGNVSACMGCCNLKACSGIKLDAPIEAETSLALEQVVSE
jgi:radical SAM protein with 4Fe4S-binding SPASM domain